MKLCTSEPTLPHVDMAGGRRALEPRHLFFFRLTASARCFLARRAAFSRFKMAQDSTVVFRQPSTTFILCLVAIGRGIVSLMRLLISVL